MQLSRQLAQVQPPPITEVKSWLNDRHFPADKPLIDLCQAIPDYSPPAELVAHLKQTLDDPLCYKYSPDEGLPQVREAVCDWYFRRYQSGPTAKQICLTIGASQAFWLAICCLCQAGDEVIVQLPAYFDHPMALQTIGVKPVFAPFDAENAGLPDNEQIEALITPRTRAILLVTPSNPTGAVIPPAQLEQLLAIARKRNIALILDETYNAFIDAPPHRLFQQTDWPEHFIHLASFGKTFAITGLRCGALIADEKLIAQALKVQDSMAVCQPRPAQLALEFGCNNLDNWVADNCSMMQQRHDLFRSNFLAAELSFELVASGSFFAWIKHPWAELNSRQATHKLIEQANLICLPGEAFGPDMSAYLRLAFGNIDKQQIPTTIKRFKL